MLDITIIGTAGRVTLMPKAQIQITHEEVGTKKTMASGRIVKDIVGYRRVLNIPVGYLRVEDVRMLNALITSGEYLTIAYPGLNGAESGLFSVSPTKL